MKLLVKGGRVVNASADGPADVLCVDGKITQIAARIDAGAAAGAEVIDATGKLVFPGFIDPHVHIHLPFMGTHAKDDWESASRAALVGGTTTLIEMVCPSRADEPWAAYELWKSKAAGKASCDYAFHMGVTRWDEATEGVLRRVVDDGTTSFKVFLAYRGAFGVNDQELYRTLSLAKELGVVVTAHCENETLVAERQAELVAAGKVGPEWHEVSRPVAVETEGVHHLMTFARLTGAAVYVVHTSCRPAVEIARAAADSGVDVKIETVLPYLVLDSSAAERPDFEGAKFVMSPPIRSREHQDYLWGALRSRQVATVGTDHAPFDFGAQKELGKPPASNFTKIPNGIPSVEHRVQLLYTHGVAAGRMNLPTFVDCASTQAARIFGLNGKGVIEPGADADLVVWDPEWRGRISAATHHMRADYSAFEGWEIKGRAAVVTVRGSIMVRDGQFNGERGHGRFVPRTRHGAATSAR